MTAGQRWQNLQKSKYCMLGTAEGAHKPRTLKTRRFTKKHVRTTRSRKAVKPPTILYLLDPWFQLRHLTCASAMVGSQVWGNELSMLTTDAVQKDGAKERAFGNAHWPNVAHGGSHEIRTLCFNCTVYCDDIYGMQRCKRRILPTQFVLSYQFPFYSPKSSSLWL